MVANFLIRHVGLTPTTRWYVFASVAITLFCLLPVVCTFLGKGITTAKNRVTMTRENRRIQELEKALAEEAKKHQLMQKNFDRYTCVYKYKCLRELLFPDVMRGGKAEKESKTIREIALRETYEQCTTSACLVAVYVGTTAVAVCLPVIFSQWLNEGA